MRPTHLLLIVLLAAFGYWQWSGHGGPIETGVAQVFPLSSPPLSLASAPFQQAINPSRKGFTTGTGDLLVPLAEFQLEARVLGAKRYRSGREAALSPLDLALGWGPMSDEQVLAALEISQSGRWYRWRTQNFPIPRRAIERHSANMHMIPANAAVADALDAVRADHVVTLRGYLVEARGDDGWSWRSSLTRDDSGAGGCEVVLVESLEYR